MRLTEPRKLSGPALYRHLAQQQLKWITFCVGNGRSYTGPNGLGIFAADVAELVRLNRVVASYISRETRR